MKVAHFSDLHLLCLDGTRFRDFVNKRWIGGLNLLANRGRHHKTEIFDKLVDDINAVGVDHVVCTGDLTNLAFKQEFDFALTKFQRLKLDPSQITVIPGNHDAYVQEGVGFFDTIFRDYYIADEGEGWDDEDPWPIVRKRGKVVFFGLSTSKQTPWFRAYGIIGEKQLSRLKFALGKPEFQGLTRVILVHHCPVGKRGKSKVRGLLDRQKLFDIIEEEGAEMVLHGHEHLNLQQEIPGKDQGVVPVHGIQSGTYEAGSDRRRARYRIYEFGADGQITNEMLRVWDVEQEEFRSE